MSISSSGSPPKSGVPRILLTGRPGCGKTTVIRRTLELVGLDDCAGFITEEVRDGGRRIGFDVVTLDGRRGQLARAGAPGPRVGRYGVDVDSFERLGVRSLEDADPNRARILVIDEIGKMELFSDRFVAVLRRVLGGDWPVIGSLMAGRNPIANSIRRRPDVQVVEVTSENRQGLPSELAAIYAR